MENLKIPLKDFQVGAVDYCLSHPYSFLADDMGLGKTAQAIAVYLNSGLTGLLIICPAYLRITWKNEIEKFSTKKMSIQTIKKGQDLNKIDPFSDAYILSYSMADKAEEIFKLSQMIVLDESHYLKNLEAKRTEAIHALVWKHKPKRLLLLSGTPIKNRVPEFYSNLVLLSYDTSGKNGLDVLKYFPTYESFCEYFCYTERRSVPTPYGRKTIRKYFGIRNVNKLKKLLEGKYIRRKYNEVFKDTETVSVDITVAEKGPKGLDELLDSIKKGDGSNPAYATLKANNALFKAPFTADHAIAVFEEVHTPIVIFTEHIESSKEIARFLHRYRTERIDGSTPMSIRTKIVEDFQAERVDFLIGTIGSMSTGVTLTASHIMIFNDLPPVPGDHLQARKRIDRIGQKKTCLYYYISGSYIDLEINKLLRNKLMDIEQAS